MSKPNLIDVLRNILLTGRARTQEEIKQSLEEQGFAINQSKISRLLHKLGAVKIANEQKQIVYALPKDPIPPASKQLLKELIISINANESLIIVRTTPGSASFIGRLLDHHNQDLNILGTVAGDDTVFIAPTSIKHLQDTLHAIQSFIK